MIDYRQIIKILETHSFKKKPKKVHINLAKQISGSAKKVIVKSWDHKSLESLRSLQPSNTPIAVIKKSKELVVKKDFKDDGIIWLT